MSRRNKNRPAGGTQPNTLTLDAFSNPLFRLGYGSQSRWKPPAIRSPE